MLVDKQPDPNRPDRARIWTHRLIWNPVDSISTRVSTIHRDNAATPRSFVRSLIYVYAALADETQTIKQHTLTNRFGGCYVYELTISTTPSDQREAQIRQVMLFGILFMRYHTYTVCTCLLFWHRSVRQCVANCEALDRLPVVGSANKLLPKYMFKTQDRQCWRDKTGNSLQRRRHNEVHFKGAHGGVLILCSYCVAGTMKSGSEAPTSQVQRSIWKHSDLLFVLRRRHHELRFRGAYRSVLILCVYCVAGTMNSDSKEHTKALWSFVCIASQAQWTQVQRHIRKPCNLRFLLKVPFVWTHSCEEQGRLLWDGQSTSTQSAATAAQTYIPTALAGGSLCCR